LGRLSEAIAAYDRALALQPDDLDTLAGKATALIAVGHLPDALAALDRVSRLRPGHGGTMVRAASVALALGDFGGALDRFTSVLALQPDFAPAHAGCGLALAGMDRVDEALVCFDRSLHLNHADPATHANRGLTLSRLGRLPKALAAFDSALHLDPGHVYALDNRGIVLRALGRHMEALDSHDAALACDSDFAPAHNNRGAALQALHRYQEALAAHDRALALVPDDAGGHNNRATALQALERYPEVLAAYDQAIGLRPDFADALGNRAVLLQMTGRPIDALGSFEAALAIRPGDANLRFNASLCRLLLGDFDGGWRDFEYRWDNALMAAERRDLGRPRWRGETNGTVLLHAEQGFGDTLQFCRYAPMVADLGVRVVVEVQPGLVRLIRRLDPRFVVVARGEALPGFDWHCPLMSLPLVLGGSIPSAEGYLRADPEATERWRTRLAGVAGRKIGLVWAGSPRDHAPALRAADRRRSVSLQQLAPLAAVPGLTFVSLQKGEAAMQVCPSGMTLLDFTGELIDFDDTAALVAALDLVISVDTAVVHLAGGLGVPVWILNRFDTCWRWLLGRSDSPWYRSATLFRQLALGDWGSVTREVAAALGGSHGQAV
jgi:tetratricopeptide (TPR) repeat protein